MSRMSVISCFPRLIIKFDAPIAVDQWILLAVDDKWICRNLRQIGIFTNNRWHSHWFDGSDLGSCKRTWTLFKWIKVPVAKLCAIKLLPHHATCYHTCQPMITILHHGAGQQIHISDRFIDFAQHFQIFRRKIFLQIILISNFFVRAFSIVFDIRRQTMLSASMYVDREQIRAHVVILFRLLFEHFVANL